MSHDFAALTANTHEDWTLFAVRFHDKPGAAELRRQLLQAHLEWVAAHQDVVRVAGSLRESPDATPVGALTGTGVQGYRFRRPDGQSLAVVWATGGNVSWTAPFSPTQVLNVQGKAVGTGATQTVGISPLYMIGN